MCAKERGREGEKDKGEEGREGRDGREFGRLWDGEEEKNLVRTGRRREGVMEGRRVKGENETYRNDG